MKPDPNVGDTDIDVITATEDQLPHLLRMHVALREELCLEQNVFLISLQEEIKKQLRDEQCLILLASFQHQFVGTLSAKWDSSGYVMLRDVWVDAEYRRLGVCRTLVTHAISDLHQWGLTRLVVKYATDDTTATAVWTSLGFTPAMVIATI